MKKVCQSLGLLIVVLTAFIFSPLRAEAKSAFRSSSFTRSTHSSSKTTLKTPETFHVPSTPSVNVRGYTKKNGTFVQPYKRTTPNKTKIDNYSTKGNINPFTGKKGYK